jgi:hypothetical protein
MSKNYDRLTLLASKYFYSSDCDCQRFEARCGRRKVICRKFCNFEKFESAGECLFSLKIPRTRQDFGITQARECRALDARGGGPEAPPPQRHTEPPGEGVLGAQFPTFFQPFLLQDFVHTIRQEAGTCLSLLPIAMQIFSQKSALRTSAPLAWSAPRH